MGTVTDAWELLGPGYPGEDAPTRAAFDILAPVAPLGSIRTPLGLHMTPTPSEVWDLAQRLARAVRGAGCGGEGGYWRTDASGTRFDPCLGCPDCRTSRSRPQPSPRDPRGNPQ